MFTRPRTTLSVLLLGLALTGCEEEFALDDVDVDDVGDAEFRAHPVCPKCKFNAATVNGFPISALDLTGAVNGDGVAAAHIRDPKGNVLRFGVHEDELAAFASDHSLVAYGDQVIGWEILFTVKGVLRPILIASREEEASWANVGAPIGVYELEGTFDDGPPRNVCPNQDDGDTALTVIHGETYDGELKRVDQVGPQWVTLACVGEAAYKVKRMGYGPSGNQGKGGGPASVAQRNSTIKMLTADYCGNGHSFTDYNLGFFWQNRARTVISPDFLMAVMPEAAWDEHGALCLTNPRHGTRKAVTGMCPLPVCSTYLKNNPQVEYEWKTYLPFMLFM